VAANVRQLRDQKYKTLPHQTARNRALAKDADTTVSQVQRVLNPALATGIDMLERFAAALGVTPADLVTPYFGNRGTGRPSPPESPSGAKSPVSPSPTQTY